MIKNKIVNELVKNGWSQTDADIIGSQVQNIYNKNKSYLDSDFEQQFVSSELKQQMDRLTELSYVDFLRKCNYNLHTTKPTVRSKSCLDIKIDDLGYGEFNCLHCSNISSIDDLKSRLTQGLDKKFVKAYMEIQKGNIPKNKSIILFYCYSDLLGKGALPIIVDDIHKDKVPLEVECLCGYNFKKTNGVEIEPRYFIDKTKWIGTEEKEIVKNINGLYKTRYQTDKNGNTLLTKNGNPRIEVLVDTTYISAVVFSPFITNFIFNDILTKDSEYYWNNDLILIHNPSAKYSIKKSPFPTYLEYYIKKKRVNNGYSLRVREIHKNEKG